ncbi:hypothetical protein CSUI_007240, partial [Cystoisospora suis]
EQGGGFTCPFCSRVISVQLIQQFAVTHPQLFFKAHNCPGYSSQSYSVSTVTNGVAANGFPAGATPAPPSSRLHPLPGRRPSPQNEASITTTRAPSGVAENLSSCHAFLDLFQRRQGKIWGQVPPSFFTSPYNTQHWCLL